MSARHDEQIWMFERTVEFIRFELGVTDGQSWPVAGRSWFFRRRRLMELKARLGQVQREMAAYMKKVK